MTRPIITIICPDARTRDLLWRHAELTGCECYHVGEQREIVDDEDDEQQQEPEPCSPANRQTP